MTQTPEKHTQNPTGSIIDWNNCHTSEQLESISTIKNDLVPRKIVERIIKSPRTQEQMLMVLNSVQSVTPQMSTTKNDLAVDCSNCKNLLHRGDGTTYCATSDGMCHYECEDPTKNNSAVDCISRAYLLDDSKYHTVFNDDTGNFEDVVYREDIEKAPPITPREPRKGYWISHREHCEMNNLLPSGLGSYFWCSECDCGIDSKDFARVNYNYCPNCGADMKEVQE